jgi:hypothetical protein
MESSQQIQAESPKAQVHDNIMNMIHSLRMKKSANY